MPIQPLSSLPCRGRLEKVPVLDDVWHLAWGGVTTSHPSFSDLLVYMVDRRLFPKYWVDSLAWAFVSRNITTRCSTYTNSSWLLEGGSDRPQHWWSNIHVKPGVNPIHFWDKVPAPEVERMLKLRGLINHSSLDEFILHP